MEHPLRIASFNAENFYLLLDGPHDRSSLDALSDRDYQAMNQSIYNPNKARSKVADIAGIIRDHDFDLLGLCEVGGRESLENFNRLYLAGRYDCFIDETNSRRGIFVGALVKRGRFARVTAASMPGDFSRNLLRLDIELQDRSLRVFVVHLKSQRGGDLGLEQRFSEVKRLSALIRHESCVVMGDFNGIAIRGEHQFEFQPLLDLPLRDVLDRVGIPVSERRTHYHFGRKPSFSQLDYIFCTPDIDVLNGGVIEGIIPVNRDQRARLPSDHLFIRATIVPPLTRASELDVMKTLTIQPTASHSPTLYEVMDKDNGASSGATSIQTLVNDMAPRIALYLRSFKGLAYQDAEDALQEAMAALWSGGPRSVGDVRPWLYRVARNRAIDILRRRRRESSRLSDHQDGHDTLIAQTPSKLPGPEQELLAESDRMMVRGFLDSLSDRDRELLHLAYAEELPYPRIAVLLGLPLGTVKWKLASLRRRLADRYQGGNV
ncbi:MAG: sigma-70 family RNA polymerase sigma factor [Spirochaetales bacterium]|nr:sigma-70 family RNA polymerase sigma factor [Spirochaetales bacterium]